MSKFEITMANKRNLKKRINRICNALFSECVAASLYNGAKKNEDANALLASIIIINDKYLCRVSHPEPGMPKKAYFNDLKEQFNIQIGEVMDQMSAI